MAVKKVKIARLLPNLIFLTAVVAENSSRAPYVIFRKGKEIWHLFLGNPFFDFPFITKVAQKNMNDGISEKAFQFRRSSTPHAVI